MMKRGMQKSHGVLVLLWNACKTQAKEHRQKKARVPYSKGAKSSGGRMSLQFGWTGSKLPIILSCILSQPRMESIPSARAHALTVAACTHAHTVQSRSHPTSSATGVYVSSRETSFVSPAASQRDQPTTSRAKSTSTPLMSGVSGTPSMATAGSRTVPPLEGAGVDPEGNKNVGGGKEGTRDHRGRKCDSMWRLQKVHCLINCQPHSQGVGTGEASCDSVVVWVDRRPEKGGQNTTRRKSSGEKIRR